MLGSFLEERGKQKESRESGLRRPVTLYEKRFVERVSCLELVGARYYEIVFAK